MNNNKNNFLQIDFIIRNQCIPMENLKCPSCGETDKEKFNRLYIEGVSMPIGCVSYIPTKNYTSNLICYACSIHVYGHDINYIPDIIIILLFPLYIHN